MTRLIDADALLDFLDVGHLRPPTEICFSELMMKNIIDIQPTIDAVPVIRCKDCVFNHGGECWGFGDGHIVCDDDYCSGGERKEE